MVLISNLFAQNQPEAVEKNPERTASDAAISTLKNARTISLKIPAPRGMILDRSGKAFAQNRLMYQVGLSFPEFSNPKKEEILAWAHERLKRAEKLVPKFAEISDEELLAYYKDRRWLPLPLGAPLVDSRAKELKKKLVDGLVVTPVYRRFYSEGGLAAHMLGYVGDVARTPKGPISFNEPMWGEIEGRSGLEKIYDQQLTGKAGIKKWLYDEHGRKLQEELVQPPRAGGNVVTTLNYQWQEKAEDVLRNGTSRGAFVVIDVLTGEVLVLASNPSFDPNEMIQISTENFKKLNTDSRRPMFSRAFQASYPPASTFKPIVALTALNQHVITPDSEIYCPAQMKIGNLTFRNWSKVPEGSIDVYRALARSCNPWFYQIGMRLGAANFLNTASQLGLGQKSGLPLMGETAGLVPTSEWMQRTYQRGFLPGDAANLSIGQGALLASPLQVAAAMAGIANGGVIPKLQLIRQVQDESGRVIESAKPELRTNMNLDPKAVKAVLRGMNEVVAAGYGTGKQAALSYTSLCGKTGTAQWGPKSKDQRLAWFAGFLPYKNPRYAFAVLYEGRPGQVVSGGRMAAPMVRKFFESVKADVEATLAPAPRALAVGADDDQKGDGKAPPRVVAVDPDTLEPIEGDEDGEEQTQQPKAGPEIPRAEPVSPEDGDGPADESVEIPGEKIPGSEESLEQEEAPASPEAPVNPPVRAVPAEEETAPNPRPSPVPVRAEPVSPAPAPVRAVPAQ